MFRVRDADCRDRQHQGDIRIREKRSTRYKTIASLIIGGTTVFKSSPYVYFAIEAVREKRKRKREKKREKGPKVTVHDSTLGNNRHRESRAPETF